MKFKALKLRKFLHSLQLKPFLPAAEKIGYTALGILLALWVNKCDEKWKKLEIEQKTLLEIKAGLEQDRRDLKETIEGYRFRVENVEAIFTFLRRDTVPADSLSTAISSLNGYSYLLANTAAYETLKSRGLEIIQNDSLRLGIATLYDVHYEAIQTAERYLDDYFNGLFLPYLITNLQLGVDRLSPVEIEKIQQDRPFLQMLWQSKAMNQNAWVGYQNALAALDKIRREIEIELNSGRF